MRKVVIDENLPRVFGQVFAKHGIEALDIRDHKLRGAPDSTIFDFAKHNQSGIATADVEFAQKVHRFENHNGIFLLRFPSFIAVKSRCERLDQVLEELKNLQLENHIVVITLSAARVNKKF